MPRALPSVVRGGYVFSVEVDKQALDAVVAMLGIKDEARREAVSSLIYDLLEDLQTARVRTAFARTIREDRHELDRLLKLTDAESMTKRLRDCLDVLEPLRTSNPVLHRRIQQGLHGPRVDELVRILAQAEEAIFGASRELSQAFSAVRIAIESEDGRGRPQHSPELSFAGHLYGVWKEFTGRGTSRQNALGREKDPFGDFVDAAGKLIDPNFDGHHVARQVHEARHPSKEVKGKKKRTKTKTT